MVNSSDKSKLSEKEKERLAKLHEYKLVSKYDKAGAFQHVVSMAAHIFNVPLAFVNFVDENSILLNASIGTNAKEVKREIGLCSIAVLRDEVTVFENTKAEPSLSGNPVVYGEPGLQFYAGAPLKTPDGFNIGVVAVADTKTRTFSKEDEKMLEGLAAIVMEELESMRLNREP